MSSTKGREDSSSTADVDGDLDPVGSDVEAGRRPECDDDEKDTSGGDGGGVGVYLQALEPLDLSSDSDETVLGGLVSHKDGHHGDDDIASDVAVEGSKTGVQREEGTKLEEKGSEVLRTEGVETRARGQSHDDPQTERSNSAAEGSKEEKVEEKTEKDGVEVTTVQAFHPEPDAGGKEETSGHPDHGGSDAVQQKGIGWIYDKSCPFEYAEESSHEGDDDMDFEKPWVKPSLKRAKIARKLGMWNQGMRDYFGTTVEEMGTMGVGIYLYFWVVRIMAIFFTFCELLSLPALILNAQGNTGLATSKTDVDSLGLLTLSYGNQGLNPSLVVESECLARNGTVDCTGDTVQVFGRTEKALVVGYILVGMEILIAACFVLFMICLSHKLEEKVEEIDVAHSSPADYAVIVRGLPSDVTKEEVRKHFHDRYSLIEPDPSYPFLGISVTGVAFVSSSTLGFLLSAVILPSVVPHLGVPPALATGVGLLLALVSALGAYGIIRKFRIGGPRRRESPSQLWERHKRLREREAQYMKEEADKSANSTNGAILPIENPSAPEIAEKFLQDRGGDVISKEEAKTLGSADAVEEGLRGQSPPRTSDRDTTKEGRGPEETPPPDPEPCQNCLNTQDKSFLGSWVADVTLGNPVGEVLRCLLEKEATLVRVNTARAVVRQMKTLGKIDKLQKAQKKLEKLQETEEDLLAATKELQDPVELEKISVAFVIFEHAESQRRCLEDYRYSQTALCRWFQPERLRFSHSPPEVEVTADENGGKTRTREPESARYCLKVLQAPEPSDVKWENLDTPPVERRLRRLLTSLICLVLLVVSFVIIYMAQTQQAILQRQIPTLDMCHATIPAAIFGTYDFPEGVKLQRNDTMDRSCEEGSFYLSYSDDPSDPNSGALDYANLPPVYSTDGRNISRDNFEEKGGGLCDDTGCQPTSGGITCNSLSCMETSWRSEGYDCVTYIRSTMVGCFCLDAVVSSFKEHGLVEGSKRVAREQGAICTPFLKDYAKANAIKILAILSVVLVNTFLTTVMTKLAEFERLASLSEYTSTVTAKLALAQFLNTALIVTIVNAGYSGASLGFLQDLGFLGGSYTDFERGWYATVGVAVAMTMLINVVVPHVGPLFGELIVKPLKRLLLKDSAATQSQLNSMYEASKFYIETRYAFLLQVVAVSMLYSGGIPILYLLAAFSFAVSFVIDKLWILKLARKPPMYSDALARMFVGVLPVALLLHLTVTCYMLGNANILNIGFVSEDAESFATSKEVKGLTSLVADHVLRRHVFPLFVFTVLYSMVYAAYIIVGDPVLLLSRIVLGSLRHVILRILTRNKSKTEGNMRALDVWNEHPGYTAEYFRRLKDGEVLESDEVKMGWIVSENDSKKAKWLFSDAPRPRGIRGENGKPRLTWQAMAEGGQHNYVMEDSKAYETAARYLAMTGILSPRMKEKAQRRKLRMATKSVFCLEPPPEEQSPQAATRQGQADEGEEEVKNSTDSSAAAVAQASGGKPQSDHDGAAVGPPSCAPELPS